MNATSCEAADACGRTAGEDAGTGTGGGGSATVTRCLGPSCPRGECGGTTEATCDGYAGFNPDDSEQLCDAATGSNQFCIAFETPTADGFVDIEEVVVDCSEVTVVRRTCSAGCGYSYSPDDCAVCNEASGCAL